MFMYIHAHVCHIPMYMHVHHMPMYIHVHHMTMYMFIHAYMYVCNMYMYIPCPWHMFMYINAHVHGTCPCTFMHMCVDVLQLVDIFDPLHYNLTCAIK